MRLICLGTFKASIQATLLVPLVRTKTKTPSLCPHCLKVSISRGLGSHLSSSAVGPTTTAKVLGIVPSAAKSSEAVSLKGYVLRTALDFEPLLKRMCSPVSQRSPQP